MRVRAAVVMASLFVFIAVLSAATTPTRGYELNLLAANAVYLACCGGVVVCAGLLSLSNRAYSHLGAVVCASTSAALLALLPIAQGYYYFGGWDAITHLGTVKDYSISGLDMRLLIYPALHMTAKVISEISGLSAANSLMIVVPSMILLFVLTTVLVANHYEGLYAAGPAAIVASWIAPIMTFQLPTLQPVPTTMSIFFMAFLSYLLFQSKWTGESRWRFIFLICLPTMLLLHPEFYLLGLGVLAVYSVFLWRDPYSPQLYPNKGLVMVALGMGLFFVWLRIRPASEGLIKAVQSGIIEGADPNISTKAEALASVGGSLNTILLRSLLPKLVIVVLAACVTAWLAKRESNCETNREDIYLTGIVTGTVALILPFVVMFAAGIVNQYFRVIGMGLMFATVIVAAGLGLVIRDQRSRRHLRTTIVVILLVGALWSIPAMYQSPYIYQPSAHMTSSSASSYEWFISYKSDGQSAISTRHPVPRYYEMHVGTFNSLAKTRTETGDEFAGNIQSQRPDQFLIPYHLGNQSISQIISRSRCVVILERDVKIETKLYNERHFSETEFTALRNQANTIFTTGRDTISC